MLLLGLKVNNSLCINIDGQKVEHMHVKELCQKINQKPCVFWRIGPFLNREKAKILLKSISMSNFSYCPQIWMYYSKTANKEINRTNMPALRVLNEDCDSSFRQLL